MISRFVDEACYAAPGMFVRVSELYAGYARWCAFVGAPAISKKAFGLELEDKGFPAKKGVNGVRFRRGLGLNEDFRDPNKRDGPMDGVSDRKTVTPKRQGGRKSMPMMSVDEALRYVEEPLLPLGFSNEVLWKILARSDQKRQLAMIALAAEVIRLRKAIGDAS